MEEKGEFTKSLIKESDDDSNDNVIVPEDDEIEEKLRTLDEVTCYFRDEKLLGVNTYRSVKQSSDLAKEGKSKKNSSKSIV